MRTDDLIITVAYFSIPLQILASLYQYPRLAAMPLSLQILVVLFAFFIFLCGAGHVLRCLEQTSGALFQVTNSLTAVVSTATCLYLIPLTPSVMSRLDENLQSLQRLNAELEASQQKLMTFMAFLCHEIRNPLFVITSNISFWQDSNAASNSPCQTAVQVQCLQAISQSADVMLRLVNDVLDISKLEAGKLELQEHDFDLRETLQGVVTSTRCLIQQRHGGTEAVKFVANVNENDLPQTVFSDSVRFLQIVYNLLTNANKFTQRGFVKFHVSVVKDSLRAVAQGLVQLPGVSSENTANANQEDCSLLQGVKYRKTKSCNNSKASAAPTGSSSSSSSSSSSCCLEDMVILKIQVQDSGCGIPPKVLERLFQPYAQSKLSNYRKHGGTGLGLSIVSKLTVAMGGTVHVKSDLGRGSSFEVYLPLQVSIQTPADNTKLPDSPQTTTTELTGRMPLPPPLPLPPLQSNSPLDPPPPLLWPTTQLPTTKTFSPPPLTNHKRMVPFDFPTDTGVVLLVEDNDMNRKLLKRMLSQFQLQVVEATNGQESVDALLSSRNFTGKPTAPEIALVLMDLSMPVMDGCEATKTIRRYRNFANLPIIALTAATIEEGKHRAYEAGVSEYQTKPIKRDVLYTLCQRYLHKAAAQSTTTPNKPQDLLS